MHDSLSRRRLLHLLAAAPLGAALAGCTETTAGPDAAAGGEDVGVDCAPTQSDALGPFFEAGAPARAQLANLDEPGERLFIGGRLAAAAGCSRLAGYTLDLWQADENGDYPPAGDTFRLRGRVTTDAEGRFAVETIMPGRYATGAGPRPAHLHVRVDAPSGLTLLTTQLYFAGDPHLGAADGCQPPTCFSDDRARTLTLRPATMEGRRGQIGEVELVVAG